jgi:flagellar basal-body rod protein FlgG
MNVSFAQAASALNANSRWQELISENLASSGVPGFRRQDMSFRAVQAGVMGPSGDPQNPASTNLVMPKSASATVFEPGDSNYTGINTNVALEGSGFFEIQLPDGSLGYTRNGEFQLNSQGQLVTSSGHSVMGETGPIQIDLSNAAPMSIAANGTVSQGTETKGQLKAVDFDDPGKLQNIGGGYFKPGDPSVTPTVAANTTFRQNYLEASNTSTTREMANLLSSMRTYEANQKVIQVSDERMAKVISDLGNPS